MNRQTKNQLVASIAEYLLRDARKVMLGLREDDPVEPIYMVSHLGLHVYGARVLRRFLDRHEVPGGVTRDDIRSALAAVAGPERQVKPTGSQIPVRVHRIPWDEVYELMREHGIPARKTREAVSRLPRVRRGRPPVRDIPDPQEFAGDAME